MLLEFVASPSQQRSVERQEKRGEACGYDHADDWVSKFEKDDEPKQEKDSRVDTAIVDFLCHLWIVGVKRGKHTIICFAGSAP